MAMCSSPVGNGAASLVAEKWLQTEALAMESVQQAKAAMEAITRSATSGIQAAGLQLNPVPESGAGTANVAYASPPVPVLPDLEYTGKNLTQVWLGSGGAGAAGYRDPGAAPEFSGATPSGLRAVTFNAPTAPPDFSATLPPSIPLRFEAPTPPADFVVPFTSPATPTFTEVASPPTFSGTVPVPVARPQPTLTATAPGPAPPIVVPEFPNAPQLVLPSAPQSLQVPLPTLRVPDLSGIDALLEAIKNGQPTRPNLTMPADGVLDTFNHLRGTLGADLTPVLPIEDVLRWMLAGQSIGLPEAVAASLRDRAFTAEDRLAAQVEQEALAQWLARGFTLPGGALEAQLVRIRQQSWDKKADLNRQMWQEEAKLEIETLRFAITSGIQYQSALWDARTKLWSVCGDLAGRFVDVQLKVLSATLEVFKAELAAWQTRADIYKAWIQAKLQAELGKLEVTKVEAEVSRLFVDLNRQGVELHKARLEGVQAEVALYKQRIDAINAQLQGQALRVEAFAKEVAAYSAQVGAYEAEWRGVAAATQSDVALVEAFKAQVQAHSAQVDAYGKRVDAEQAKARLQVEVGQMALAAHKTQADVYVARVDAYGKQVQAEASRVQAESAVAQLALEAHKANAQVYGARVEAFGKQVQAEASRVQAEAEVAKLPVDIFKAETQAYSARVEAYGKRVQAAATESTARVELEKLGLEAFRNTLEAHKAELQRVATEMEARAKTHTAQVTLFGAQVESEKGRVSAELQNMEQRLRQTQFEASLELRKAELEQTKVLEMAKIAMNGESEAARVATQLAGAALSAVSASASIGNSYSAQSSQQCSEEYRYEM